MTWFTLSTPLTAHTLARAKNVNAIFTSVATSFAKLMDSDLFRDRRIFIGTDTGAVNAYVVTLAPAPVDYVVGMTIDLLAANTNTGASTINVNGLGAKSVLDSSGAAAGAGLIVANRITTLKYDGTAFRTAPTQTVVTPGDGTVTVAKLAPPLSTMAANLSNSWNPATDDTTDLGQATHRWRNIFMAALAVINFNNGNYTLTHSAGLLTASGALTVTGNLTATGGAISGASVSVTGAVSGASVSATGTITGNLFSGSGASLTSLPSAQLTGALPAISGASLTSLNASNLASGTVSSARLSGSYAGITGLGTLTGLSTNGNASLFDTDNTDAVLDVRQDGTAPIQRWLGSGAAEVARMTAAGSLQIGSSSAFTSAIFAYRSSTATTVIVRQDGAGDIQLWQGSGGAQVATMSAGGIMTAARFTNGTFSATGATGGFMAYLNVDAGRIDISANSLNSRPALAFYNPNGNVGSVSISGSATAYNTSSDEFLKNFIGPYDPAEAIRVIRADPVRDFHWKADGTYAIGWGAQTSYRVSKDLATPGHGKPGDDGYMPWGVDQGKRTPYLWAFAGYAIGVLDDHHNILTQHAGMLDDHETRIEALEAENAALKAQLAKLTN